jgi:hypothetical protein
LPRFFGAGNSGASTPLGLGDLPQRAEPYVGHGAPLDVVPLLGRVEAGATRGFALADAQPFPASRDFGHVEHAPTIPTPLKRDQLSC